MPELKEQAKSIPQRVLAEMQQERIRGTKTYLKKVHNKRCYKALNVLQKDLSRKYKCSPRSTTFLPPLSQLPLFFVMTQTLQELSMSPESMFDSESFLTLSSLAHPDPTLGLPILVGVLTMANIEASSWLTTWLYGGQRPNAPQQQSTIPDAKKDEKEAVTFSVKPSKILQNGMRMLSPIRIVFAALAPGSVALYWATSAVYGLIQTWLIEWLARRWRAQGPGSLTRSLLPWKGYLVTLPSPNGETSEGVAPQNLKTRGRARKAL